MYLIAIAVAAVVLDVLGWQGVDDEAPHMTRDGGFADVEQFLRRFFATPAKKRSRVAAEAPLGTVASRALSGEHVRARKVDERRARRGR